MPFCVADAVPLRDPGAPGAPRALRVARPHPADPVLVREHRERRRTAEQAPPVAHVADAAGSERVREPAVARVERHGGDHEAVPARARQRLGEGLLAQELVAGGGRGAPRQRDERLGLHGVVEPVPVPPPERDLVAPRGIGDEGADVVAARRVRVARARDGPAAGARRAGVERVLDELVLDQQQPLAGVDVQRDVRRGLAAAARAVCLAEQHARAELAVARPLEVEGLDRADAGVHVLAQEAGE